MVKQKGAHPYECMDSFKTFCDENLSERCACFSSVKHECISEKYYLLAIDVWNLFKLNTMGDYHHLYLKTELPLIADTFKRVCRYIFKILWITPLSLL